MGTPFRGRIKFFNPERNFGRIATQGGPEIFFHRSMLKGGEAREGAEVEGEWEQKPKGPEALEVRLAGSGAKAPAAPPPPSRTPAPPPPSAPAAPPAPAPALKPYYLDAAKTRLRPELVGEEAEETARRLVAENLSRAQLRRFFDEVRHLERVVRTHDFEVARPLIRLLAARAHYAYGYDRKIPAAFLRYLVDHVRGIHDRADFEAFVKSFEALTGYYYSLRPSEGNRAEQEA